MGITLSDQTDVFVWRLTTSVLFSVKSMYLDFFKWASAFFSQVYMENEGTIKDKDLYVFTI